MLSDGDHVRNLLGEYCWRIDAGDFDGVGELFAHGSLADDAGRPLATGADAVAEFYRGGTQIHGTTPATKHVVADTVLEEGDPTAAGDPRMIARSSYVVFQATGDSPLRPIIAGRYVDTFEQVAGRWRFAERRFIVDLVADLSEHLTFLLPGSD